MFVFGKKEKEGFAPVSTSTSPKKVASLIVAFSKHKEYSEKYDILKIKEMVEEIGNLVTEQEMRLVLFAAHLIGCGDLKTTQILVNDILSSVIAVKALDQSPEQLIEGLMKAMKNSKSKK